MSPPGKISVTFIPVDSYCISHGKCLAKSESSMLPKSIMESDYTIDYRKHSSLSFQWK